MLFECFYRQTFGTGTVQSNRKGLPKGVVGAKLKKGESCFRRNGELLCLKWCEKQEVTILTTIEDAIEVAWKEDKDGNILFKPKAMVEYTTNMRGCDLSDQLMTSYCMLCRTLKWWRKLFFHLFSLVLNNAYILHTKFGIKPIAHDTFLEKIVCYLIDDSMHNATTKLTRKPSDINHGDGRFVGQHYPVHITKCAGSKNGSKLCKACNFSKKELASKQLQPLKQKLTSYECKNCKVALCIEPCFKVYHTEIKY